MNLRRAKCIGSFCRERRGGHAKGDERRRCAALGDIAEADRVFALRLAGLG